MDIEEVLDGDRNPVERAAVDADGWEWRPDLPVTDARALPGALRFGGMKAFAALAAPRRLLLYRTDGLNTAWLREAYRRLGASDRLALEAGDVSPAQLGQWLSR